MEADCQLGDALCVVQLSQGFGVGSLLMHHVFDKACVVASQAGCHAIILDVMSDGGEKILRNERPGIKDLVFKALQAMKPGCS